MLPQQTKYVFSLERDEKQGDRRSRNLETPSPERVKHKEKFEIKVTIL